MKTRPLFRLKETELFYLCGYSTMRHSTVIAILEKYEIIRKAEYYPQPPDFISFTKRLQKGLLNMPDEEIKQIQKEYHAELIHFKTNAQELLFDKKTATSSIVWCDLFRHLTSIDYTHIKYIIDACNTAGVFWPKAYSELYKAYGTLANAHKAISQLSDNLLFDTLINSFNTPFQLSDICDSVINRIKENLPLEGDV